MVMSSSLGEPRPLRRSTPPLVKWSSMRRFQKAMTPIASTAILGPPHQRQDRPPPCRGAPKASMARSPGTARPPFLNGACCPGLRRARSSTPRASCGPASRHRSHSLRVPVSLPSRRPVPRGKSWAWLLLSPCPPSAEFWIFTADVGLVHLDHTSESASTRAHEHRAQTMQHRPSCLVGADLECLLKTELRDAVLLCSRTSSTRRTTP